MVFDPLVLDLDGDGIELVSIQQSTAQFDLNADGFREQTGWVKADDGMLALDANGDGKINNINELFGDAVTDGFDELKTLDSNNDNIINASDTKFSQLKIWRDLNQNGITDTGELKTLAETGVKSISLITVDSNVTNEGNLIRTTGKYTKTNGIQNDVVSLWFEVSNLNTSYDLPYQLKAETLFLPTTRGYGKLPDLYISMSLDSQLLGLMRQFAGLTIQNLDRAHAKIEEVLFRWAKVDGINPTSRGQFFDARKLGFLESFLQEPITNTFNSAPETVFVRQAWNTVISAISARLLVQGAMRDLFPNATYSLNNDALTIGEDLATALNRLSTNLPTIADNLAHYWAYGILILDQQADRFNLTQTAYDNQLKTALTSSGLSAYLDVLRRPVYGSAGDDMMSGDGSLATFLDGSAGNDTLTGTAQNDILNAGDGNDVITSGGGIDKIDGGAGNDIIYAGGGNNNVDGGAGNDTLIDADFSTATNNLTINNTSNPLISLSTGTEIKNVERFVNVTTGSGNDTISFTGREDNTIYTGAGNDVINAGLGANDSVAGGAGTDQLTIDYSVADTGTGMQMSVGNGSASRYNSDYSILDAVYFNNIEQFNITGTSKDDTITTSTGNDTIRGGAGDDIIDGGGGKDLYIIDADVDTGLDTIDDSTGGIDTLDFRSTTTKAININLALTTTQTVATGVQLLMPTIAIENVLGGALNDTIRGNNLNNTLNGGTGVDTMIGGLGNDVYVVDNAGDFVTETSTLSTEIDTVQSSVNYALVLNVENLTLTGTAAINGTGNAGNNTIIGNTANNILNGGAGNDYLNGGTGVDTMIGGLGNDVYVVDNAGDFVTETSTLSTEIDTVQSSVNYALVLNVENLTLTGTAAINGTGNILNNTIVGNNAANILYGGAGNDALTGGLGSDIFQFKIKTEGIDTISDFMAGDKIAISAAGFGGGLAGTAISASQFGLGAAATTASQRVMYNSATGGLFFDADGSGAGAAFQFATLLNKPTLGATDFVVI